MRRRVHGPALRVCRPGGFLPPPQAVGHRPHPPPSAVWGFGGGCVGYRAPDTLAEQEKVSVCCIYYQYILLYKNMLQYNSQYISKLIAKKLQNKKS